MNFLTFVFSLLLIFSFGTFVTLEKQVGNRRLRSTCLGHVAANRKILSQCERETYQTFRSLPKPAEKISEASEKQQKKPIEAPPINPECSRINLKPLLHEGRKEHPYLYETALRILKTFYSRSLFADKPQTVELFFNAFLKKIEESIGKEPFCLEKLAIEPPFQMQYYKMRKGTKEWDAEQKLGYPSLLDIFKIDESPSKICLAHAHPGLLAALFNDRAAQKLFQLMHQENPVAITKEVIENTCSESHIPILDPAIFDLIELKRSTHRKRGKTTLVAEDRETHISLRKNIYGSSS